MSELYIGFMSGTSLDGVDASLIKTDGENEFTPVVNCHIPYPKDFKAELKKLLPNHGPFLHGPFLNIEKRLTEFHIEAAQILLKKANLSSSDIRAIGFHGQTLFHKAQEGVTLQIGNPHLLAQKTRIDVVYDFRRRDISLGGQGAPLVPIFHKLLMKDQDFPVAVLNIGGVANLTYIDNDNIIAFDTGPGNALIDDAMNQYFDMDFDEDGNMAAKGSVDYNIVNNALEDKYFKAPYPKSLDRNNFNFLQAMLSKSPSPDIIATLTYITSTSIAESIRILPKMPKKIFISGGGSKNIQMIKYLEEILSNQGNLCKIENISTVNGLDPEYIESQAFAYLAARFFKDLPSAFPSTTNASKPNICGSLVRV